MYRALFPHVFSEFSFGEDMVQLLAEFFLNTFNLLELQASVDPSRACPHPGKPTKGK